MADETAKKLCGMCFEQIDRRARMCPYCGIWQWKSAWRFFLPLIIVLGAFVASVSLLVSRFERIGFEEPHVRYQGQIEVTQSEMFFGQSKDGPTVFVVGKLKNNSDVTWGRIRMEVEFMDPDGKLIDVNVEDYYLSRILPRDEMAFKLRGLADLPKERYASYEVFVTSAE